MDRRFRWNLVVAAALSAPIVVPVALAAPPDHVPGELIVRFRPAASAAAREAVRGVVGARRIEAFDFIEAEHLGLPPGLTVEQAVARLRNHPLVQYAQPNYVYTAGLVPNDPRFPELYALRNTGQTGGTPGADIRAVNAWDVFTGDPGILIGVIDTGIDYNHPDLSANVWRNPGEIPGNGIDDDGNGYVDDVHGYDFVNNDGDPFDDNGHGTHVSGTIAAHGNNGVGVVGVNWRARLVGIKFLNAAGSGSTAGAIASVQYAVRVGVRLTSNSWGGGGFDQGLLDAINAAGVAGQLFVAAAGNSSRNNDTSPHYPSSYNTPYIIAVASTDHNDNLSSFSNYGATSVDLGAPGSNILSCQPGGGYQLLSGTSMATPHVAGVCALAWGRFPSFTPHQIKALVLNNVDVRSSLTGRVLTNGRLNAFMTIADPDTLPPGAIADLQASNPGSNTMDLAWTATGDDGSSGRASSYELRYSLFPIDEGNFPSATLVPGTPNPQTAGSPERFGVTGLAFLTTYHFAIKARDEYNNPGPISNVASGTTLGIPNIAAAPDSFFAELLTGASDTQTLTLANTADGTLDFTIPVPVLLNAVQAPAPMPPTPKDDEDRRVGEPVVTGAGGPDGFGYRWIDSDQPGGPVFDWVDITGVGTQVPLVGDDVTSAPIAMGMSFPFYGRTYGAVRVSSNGFLSFSDTGAPYSNQPLPSAGGVRDMVAPFWDDIDLRTAGRVYTHHDGARFIVSYVDCPHYAPSGTGVYTFQALLYPSGEIRYQYRTMSGLVTSATVGIQDSTKTVGLTVAFNATYVRDSLAVKISATPQWLTVQPTSGRIPAGGSAELEVRMDATGLIGGNFRGHIQVLSNDPDGSPLAIPAHLHVIGAPNIAPSPAAIAFGTVLVGSTPTRTLIVANSGTDDLHVTSITSDDPSVTATPTFFTVTPSGGRAVTVRWAPAASGALNATLTIASDDPDQPTEVVPVTGEAVPAPSFAVDPESLAVNLNIGEQTSRNVRVQNNGGSNYVFTAEAIADLPPSAAGRVDGDADNVPLAKGEADRQFGPAPLRSGGPDAFGYTYRDSDEPDGPTFGWIDIRPIGTLIPSLTGDDQNGGPFPIGFGFPFYGNTFTTFRVCTNGWVSFTNSTLTTYTNTTLPNSGATVPENLLAIFWDDLHFNGAPRAYYHSDGSRLVIQYQDVPRIGDLGRPNTFEIVLHADGTIVYQYLSMTAVTQNSATIGIQNAARNDGLQVAFNAAYVRSNLAIRFRPPARFMSVAPAGGTIPPGGFADLAVGFNAVGLSGGQYTGRIRIRGNDPVLPEKNLPCRVTVTGVPAIVPAPTSIGFGDVYVGYAQVRQLLVQNPGTDALIVSDVTASDPAFGVDVSSFTVPQGGSALVTVSFSPGAGVPYNATLTIESNDPSTPYLDVPLSGTGVIPPRLALGSHTLDGLLSNDVGPRGRKLVQPLLIRNPGGSALTWSAAAAVGIPGVAPAGPRGDPQAAKGEEGPPGDPVAAGSGGPDGFGYRWVDSDAPGGPAFSWVDITAVGTRINLTRDDQNSGPIPLPFAFPFYGNSFTSIRVCTNGWLSFTAPESAYVNVSLPNSGAGVPANLIAPFWDDLDFRSAGAAYSHYDGSRFIVSYVAVPRFSASGTFTFQALLYPSGEIHFQYLDMQGVLNSATIGIQNQTRDIGLQVVFNAAYVHNNLRVRITRLPTWLSVSPLSGVTAAGREDTVWVAFDAAGVPNGDFQGTVSVTSNAPQDGSQQAACRMHVGTVHGTMDLRPDYSFPATFRHGWIEAVLTPGPCPPDGILLESLLATGDIPPAPGSSLEIEGCGAVASFKRLDLIPAIPGGSAAVAGVSGVLADVSWFIVRDTLRMLRPILTRPADPYAGGSAVTLTWSDGDAAGATSYRIGFSPDNGRSWQLIADEDTDYEHVWTVPSEGTAEGWLELMAYDGAGYMGSTFSGPFAISAQVSVSGNPLPAQPGIRLRGANPTASRAVLELAVPARGTAVVRVFDVNGALVRELARGEFDAGTHLVRWDGTTQAGLRSPAGMYFVKAVVGGREVRTRIALLR